METIGSPLELIFRAEPKKIDIQDQNQNVRWIDWRRVFNPISALIRVINR